MTVFQVIVHEIKEYIPDPQSKAPAFPIVCPGVGSTLTHRIFCAWRHFLPWN